MGEYLPTDLCNELLTMYPSTLKTTKRKISPGPDENNEPSSKVNSPLLYIPIVYSYDSVNNTRAH